MKILAVTVVYNPSAEMLLRSVASYAGSVDKVLVWRNSALPAALEEELTALGCELRNDGVNVGIAKALNAAWHEAASGGYDALLTMDQDSVWHGFDGFLAAVCAADAPAGFYSPLICQNGEEPAFFDGFVPVDTAFTSGMLVPLAVLARVGGWDESFMVDGVDNEFCLHALSLGIRCWRSSAGWLEHRLGRVEFRNFLGLKFRVYKYSPERLYGIYRNNLTAIRRYPDVSGGFRRQFCRGWGWRRPLRMLLGEKDLCAKFHAIRRGVKDAKRQR